MWKKQFRDFLVKFSGLFLLLFAVLFGHAQQIPARPVPPRLLNDFSNTLNASQQAALERKLVAYNDTTSTQIAVVFVNDLQGTTAADFAYQIGEKWGVGTKENNGIVILIKPKNETKGEVFISVGYGLEPYITDAAAKRIIENKMIPAFKENDYYYGISCAIEAIAKLTHGDFSTEKHSDNKTEIFILIFFVIMMVVMILFITFAVKVGKTYSSKHDDSSIWRALFWANVFSNNNSHKHHDNWDNFTGGSGGFGGFGGGSSGGFGGFGGGRFGGGGAGGSW